MDNKEAERISDEFAPGVVIDFRYKLVRKLGEGGMGLVFLAHDRRLDRNVAIKVVSQNCVHDPQLLATSLEREAKLAAALNHPSIAVVHDFGIYNDKPFVVFEFVDGHNLRTSLHNEGAFGIEKVKRFLMPLARALDFAHSNDVIHRDLKPENICMASNGTCKILDFGIAINMRTEGDDTVFAGTPAYASPEQSNGAAVDGRTDQYALACIVFELISGRKVFTGENKLDLLLAHAKSQPPRLCELIPDIPVEVDQAINRALQKDPEQRFATCQEFAEAIGCEPARILANRLKSGEYHFFVSHISCDSIFARTLARCLDQLGYSTWYYQRDALPGLSLFQQTREKIRQSSACVFLISRSSIDSSDFANEIYHAHRSGCAMIPVLVDMSLQEFESIDPDWKTVLGPIVKLEVKSNEADALAGKIHSVSESYAQITDQKSNSVAIQTETTRVRGPVWATDAYQISTSELEKVIFKNQVIDEFLDRKNKFFVSATKGLGKTLLLTYKRQLLTQQNTQSNSRVILVPTGRPFLDFMGDLRILSEKYEKPLSELNTAKRIWSLALRISAVSYQPGMISEDEAFELEPFPKRLQRALNGHSMEPTLAFKELTRLSVSDLNQLVDISEGFLDQKLRQVHTPVFFFIDKVDQAIRKLGTEAWINVQAGLIEAAWDLMNANTHIKVYCSIRHEAFCNYQSDIKSNLSGAVSVLRYTDTELGHILDNLSRCYEGESSFKEFVGLNVVNSGRRPFLEDSFQLIRRFTFGRPRDLVLIASELSSLKGNLNEQKYCETVRDTAASNLVPAVFDESAVFLRCLHDHKSRVGFLSLIPANVLSREQVWEITSEFNGVPKETFAEFTEIDGFEYPFLDLFMAGLLGIVRKTADTDDKYQVFRQPDDLIASMQFRLPLSDFYLVHPSLERYIEKAGMGDKFRISRQIRLGHDLQWQPYYHSIHLIEWRLWNVEQNEFVEKANQFLIDYQTIASGRPTDRHVESLITSDQYNWLKNNANDDASEEVVYLLNELLNPSKN